MYILDRAGGSAVLVVVVDVDFGVVVYVAETHLEMIFRGCISVVLFTF